MKIKNINLLTMLKGYSKNSQNTDFTMDVIALYTIRKNMQNIEIAYKPCGELLDEILAKKEGRTNDEIQRDINKLMEQEVDVDIKKIPISVFDGVKATPAFVDAIFIMLE